ncbi:Thymidylate kinase [Candidatus Westeberhardia cardiocondylae]|uniref:Thymidylate kinase n=1 Tax=Candidatus Westeberhardia cardiocondylae TaxID=1594731 RepID=A0A0H5BWW5_9ENTR|nr:dTMP kinase [Candidatus Westeberhardia cardiocondylae]CEN32183.1 Thymidylate kinase [Candidatus Westeberhardia cardiocondylae]
MLGKFIVVEGLEGAGKTTASKEIIKILHNYGIFNIIKTREPGGTPLAEKMRVLIKTGFKQEPITKYAELLMCYIARAQLVENIIKPALLQGSWVICDRHDFSSFAYQGGGRKINKNLLKVLHYSILKNFHPNLIFYLDVSPIVGLSRIKKRNKTDRIEKETLSFFKRTRFYYKKLAKKNKYTFIIDANETLEKVNNSIKNTLKNWLK